MKPIEYCTQCQEPILPGDLFLAGFEVGDEAPMHEGCYILWEDKFHREVFWFDYVMPGSAGCDCSFCRTVVSMV